MMSWLRSNRRSNNSLRCAVDALTEDFQAGRIERYALAGIFSCHGIPLSSALKLLVKPNSKGSQNV